MKKTLPLNTFDFLYQKPHFLAMATTIQDENAISLSWVIASIYEHFYEELVTVKLNELIGLLTINMNCSDDLFKQFISGSGSYWNKCVLSILLFSQKGYAAGYANYSAPFNAIISISREFDRDIMAEYTFINTDLGIELISFLNDIVNIGTLDEKDKNYELTQPLKLYFDKAQLVTIQNNLYYVSKPEKKYKKWVVAF